MSKKNQKNKVKYPLMKSKRKLELLYDMYTEAVSLHEDAANLALNVLLSEADVNTYGYYSRGQVYPLYFKSIEKFERMNKIDSKWEEKLFG